MEERNADEIFKEFREHSVAEFFKKNRQMLGYAGKVRSMTTIVHEYVTNALDATEEGNILPEIDVNISQAAEDRYRIGVMDNGPGIPKHYIGKVLATVLAGTKFHRYLQQRGQQGIGGAGCTMFAQTTTGKPIFVKASTAPGKAYSCNLMIDTIHNKPVVSNLQDIAENFRGLFVEGEFADIKYENSDHGVYEYIKRTALANPHAQIRLTDPEGKEHVFMRAVNKVPERPKQAQPHPLGLSVNDLLEFAHASPSTRISSFLVDTFERVTSNKVNELKTIATGVDFAKTPKELTWPEAEELIKAFKSVKWIAPDASNVKTIGKDQITLALKNVLNPEFMNVVERRPSVFRGGVPFIVEAAVAFGGNAGRKTEEGYAGSILRFANRVPLLFDSGVCAITVAAKDIDWKRYGIDMETQPVSIFVNISSVYIPYSGVGKEAISQEDAIIEEIKLAIMEAARGVQHYIHGKKLASSEEGKYKTVMRYAKQLSQDLSDITGKDMKTIERHVNELVLKHYPRLKENDGAQKEEGTAASEESES
jgi:DNA topoisomerase-6 subunit B